ncbi:MAG: isoaspartyl peptidase/L-asparaginase [Thaumarchaeota archaeon]|nr:isoaspartyl peptidase/L-asparaginase [Nitrososphaerota archaeon]
MVHGGAGSGKYVQGDKRFHELQRAVEEGMSAMKKGSSLDGVEAAVRYMEDSGAFNAGRGACLNAAGEAELDAAVMTARRRRGAGVGLVTCTHNPVSLARWVSENTPHVLLAGERCSSYARAAGLEVEELVPLAKTLKRFRLLRSTPDGTKKLELWRRLQQGNTVGAVALDSAGVPSAAVSTGGMWLKLPGRVGDSAIIGAGIYADVKAGAACATGTGEEIIRNALCLRACELMRKVDARVAARRSISLMTRSAGKGTAGIITVDPKGRVGASWNTEAMGRAWYDPGRGKPVVVC